MEITKELAAMIGETEDEQIVLKHGRFATVYEGKYKSEDVAVKLFNTQEKTHFKHEKEKLLLLQQVQQHPHIVKLIGYKELVLVLEHCGGGTVKQHLQELNWESSIKVLQQTIDALAFISTNNLVFGNFKPNHILLTKDGNAKLCDFGAVATKDGIMSIEDPEYLPPGKESRGPAKEKHDVYAYGVTMMEILAKRDVKGQATNAQKQKLKNESKGRGRNKPDENGPLVDWVQRMAERDKSIVNAAFTEDSGYSPDKGQKLTKIAARCTETSGAPWFTIAEVKKALEEV